MAEEDRKECGYGINGEVGFGFAFKKKKNSKSEVYARSLLGLLLYGRHLVGVGVGVGVGQ